MRPLRLQAQNVARFPSVELQFPDGTISLSGANGSGKSTLLSTLELALFADGSRDLAPLLGPFGDRLELALELEHAGERYRVRRTFGKGKATLDLDLNMAGHVPDVLVFEADWVPLTRETTKETQAHLESLLGLSRRTFNASAYLAQGDSGNFTEASPADRKMILAEVLDPRGFWPRLAQQASDERKVCERALEADRVRIDEREQFLSAVDNELLPERLENAQGHRFDMGCALADIEQDLGELQQAIAANAAALERAKAAAQAETAARIERARCQAALEEAQGRAAELEPARVELAEAEQQAGRVAELERLVEEQRTLVLVAAADEKRKGEADQAVERQDAHVRSLQDAHELLQGDWIGATTRADHLEQAAAGTERCDRCEQLLGAEAREAALASLRAEAASLWDAIDAKRAGIKEAKRLLGGLAEAASAIPIHEAPALNGYDDALRQARTAAERLSGLRERIRGYDEALGNLPLLSSNLTIAQRELERRAAENLSTAKEARDDAELRQAADSARARQRQARAALDEANAAVTRLEEQLARVREAEKELAALKTAAAERQGEVDLLRLAERAFGRDGIPTLIAENALGSIEAHANGYLAMMPLAGGETLRVQLETQRALKTADHLRETLDVLVADPDGVRPFETFSGGERARVSIALRLALAILLADRRGAESRLLAIDEIEGLDAEGQRQLVDVVRSVASRFDVVLVASHYGGIRDAFDQQWQVVKEDGVSRLEAA